MVYNFLVIFFNNEAAWPLRCTGFVHREESLAHVMHGLGSPNLLSVMQRLCVFSYYII